MNIGRILYWLGIIIMIVELVTNLMDIHQLSVNGGFNVNATSWIFMLLSSFYQGGVLIGLGKIIELMQSKKAN